MSIEEQALQWARDYLENHSFNYIGNDEQIKMRMDILFPGGWETFCHETWNQVVA